MHRDTPCVYCDQLMDWGCTEMFLYQYYAIRPVTLCHLTNTVVMVTVIPLIFFVIWLILKVFSHSSPPLAIHILYRNAE